MKNVTKNILLLLVSVIICLLILEGFLRVYNPFKWRVKKGKIVLPINRKYIFHNTKIDKLQKEIVHTKNSLGFRGEEPPENLKDSLSIIIVGGSTAECFYLSDDETWPYFLVQKLKMKYDNVWLNNAGLAGYSTFGHIILVRDYLGELKPKIIIFLVGANEIGRDDLSKYDKVALADNHSSLKNFIVKNSEVVSLFANMSRLLMAHKAGVSHKNIDIAKMDKLEIPQDVMDSEMARHRKEYIPAYKKRLSELAYETRKIGAEPIFVTQPMLWTDGADKLTGVNLGDRKVYASMNGKLYWEILKIYNDATRKVAKEKDIFLIDLAGKMPKNSLYFYDDWHYTREGADILSQIVYGGLEKHLDEKYGLFVKKKEEQK